MATLTSFLQDILPQLPGCPTVTVVNELRRTLQVFFEKTRAWKMTLDSETMSPGESEVTISSGDSGRDLVRVEQVWFDGRLLSPVSGDMLSDRGGDDWQERSGTPQEYLQDTPGVVRLYPTPASPGRFVARISVKPSDSATSIPDELAVKYRNDLTAGAKGRLMLYVGQPWSNPAFGEKHEAEFKKAIDRENASAALSFGKSRIASNPRFC